MDISELIVWPVILIVAAGVSMMLILDGLFSADELFAQVWRLVLGAVLYMGALFVAVKLDIIWIAQPMLVALVVLMLATAFYEWKRSDRTTTSK